MIGSVTLSRDGRKLVEHGELNVYSQWILKAHAEPGMYVKFYTHYGECLGTGFYEGVGAMGLRVLSRRCDAQLEEILAERIESAYNLRERIYPDHVYRLINADGDMLPGLVADRYGDILVIQSTSMGFDRHLDLLISVLRRTVDGISTIYLKNDQRSRVEAGLPISRRIVWGAQSTRTIISEGKAQFYVDVERGQKTGFFLDQRENRVYLEKFVSPGDRVLDLYSYTGGFAIHALLAGAREAVMVEEMDYPIEEAKRNLELNGLDATIIRSRVEKALPGLKGEFDIVTADPPAYVPRRQLLRRGLKMYRRVYGMAIEKLRSGGILVASSCSAFLKVDEFINMINKEARNRGREAKLLEVRGAAPDHTSRARDMHLRYLKTTIWEIR